MASTTSQSTVTKTFAQALSNSCNIPASQLPKPCLKGKQISIKIIEDEYLAGVLDCQNVLHGRFTLPKGSSPVPMLELKAKILNFWKMNAPWSMVSLGKGFLRTFVWTADFNPHSVQHTIAQTWIRIHALDEATMKRTFGHFARVLIEVDLNSDLHERILVERNAFDFYVDIEYEKLPLFCNSCQIIGHSVKNCKFQTPNALASSTTVNKPKARPIVNTSIVEKPFEVTSSSSGMTSPIVGDVMNLENEDFCEELHEEDEVVADSFPLENQAKPIVAS
ncbi:hypothetical protein TSUD_243170 [Trifolium subterraneum]|uniref:Zinc knuckle CX2CX4HX4C domain-containing protein n=1 Tax=Trifolium subterraneum TaxID=3900 RepID=A0A2Z6PSC3_TRISU|nr:hypothetical protein TSUD_243170 [Trifolium subterraneum]